MQRFLLPLFSSPVFRRLGWHIARVRGAVDRRFFGQLLLGAFVLVLIAASIITLVEKPLTFASLGASMNWGVQTILGQGDSSYVTSPVGWVVGWFFSLFGIAIIGTLTGALVALVIDFLLKEGQGLGASGYTDHIIVCGWNTTARDLVDELKGDDYHSKVVVIADLEKNPAGSGVYFVRGDATNAEDLERAGIHEAAAARRNSTSEKVNAIRRPSMNGSEMSSGKNVLPVISAAFSGGTPCSPASPRSVSMGL